MGNGQVDDNRDALGQPVEYAEPPLLFQNEGGKRFRLATRDAGTYFDSKHVCRGAAFGDIDDDGDIDIVISHKDGAPALLRNDTSADNHWIRLELQGTRSNRDAVGARVEVVVPAGAISGGRESSSGEKGAETVTIYRQRKGGSSMESAHDPRLLIGVGRASEVARLTVRWPSGATSVREHLATNRSYKVVEPGDDSRKKAALR